MQFSEFSLQLPVTDPTLIFFLVLVIILFAPVILERLHIPHIVGLILAGVLVGQHGFNILKQDSSFDLFGKVGLYYIMFLAGLEMNMEEDHIHMLINCTPQHYIPNIIKAMKGVSARLLMKEFGDDLRSKLWGGHLWNPSYFVATVSENTEEQIIEYIRSQKRK